MSFLRRLLPRFSLRTLLFFVLMVGSGGVLWLRWEPWQAVVTLRPGGVFVQSAKFSQDGRYVVTHSRQESSNPHARTVLWERSGRELHRVEWTPNWTRQGYHDAIFLPNSDYLLLRAMPFPTSMQLVSTQNFKMVFPKEGASEVVYSADYKHCAALLRGFTRERATVACYDLRSGEEKAAWHFIPGSDSGEPVPHIRISSDGTWVLVVAHEYGRGPVPIERLYLCNTITQERKRVSIPNKPIERIVFNTDGTRFVVLTFKSFQVFETATRAPIMDGMYDAFFQWSSKPTDFVLLNTDNISSILKLSGAQPVVEKLPKEIARQPMGLTERWLYWKKGSTLTVRDLATGRDYSTECDDVDLTANISEDTPGKIVFRKSAVAVVEFDVQHHSFRPSQSGLSPDGTRMIENSKDLVLRAPSGEVASRLQPQKVGTFAWSPDSQQFIRSEGEHARIYARVRSDEAWNLLREPALWLAIFFAGGFLRSLWLGLRARLA